MIKFDSQLESLDSNVWNIGAFIPPQIIEHLGPDRPQRYSCTINGSSRFSTALLPYGNGRFYININKTLRKTFNVSVGDTIHIALEEDQSRYGMPIPEEFEQALSLDPQASELFHRLTPGKQRNLIYLTAQPKRSETRIKKSLLILEHLKLEAGQLDFKKLNALFKAENNSM